jgi:hypothetical protein
LLVYSPHALSFALNALLDFLSIYTLFNKNRPSIHAAKLLSFNNYQTQVSTADHKLATSMEDTENDNDTEGMPQPTQEFCTQEVTALFPDICLQSLQSIAAPLNFSPQAVINHILDLTESGQTYTKREQPKQASGKRKRDTSEQHDGIEERVRKDRRLYTSDDRQQSQLSQRDPRLV